MTTRQKKDLEELRKFLKTARTADDVCEMFGISRPTAYRRLRIVGAKGVKHVRQGATGPQSIAWRLR
jgi:predicted DNA-binding transcriptional regulator AlpA